MSHPDPTRAPAPPSGGGAPLALVLVLVLLVGAGAGAAGYVAAIRGPDWLRADAPPPAPAPAAQPAEAAVDARLADIQARLIARQAAEDQTDAVVVASAEVQALSERLARLERRQDRTLEAASTALAVAALDRAAQGSGAFASALSLAGQSLPPSPDLERLAAIAPHGAPSLGALAASFPEAARKAVAARQAGGPGQGWMARLSHALAGVVTVRRLDVSGDSPDAALARAEARLTDGDLEGALEDLKALPGPQRQAMAGWLESARRRAAVDRSLAAIRAETLRQLGRDRASLGGDGGPRP